MKIYRRKSNLLSVVLAAVVLLTSFALTGCMDSLFSPTETDENGGTLKFSVVVPDYSGFGAAGREADAQVVSPATTYVRVILDGDGYDNWNFIEIPLTPVENEGVSGEHGQLQIMEAAVGGVPARTYNRVTLELLDSSNNVLTTGTAFGVDVLPFETVQLYVTCFVTADLYDYVTVDGDAQVDFVGNEQMKYYKFYGYEGIEYAIEAEATTGTPDLYLFKPTGSPVRTPDQLIYLAGFYDGDVEAARLLHTAESTGMYVVGVYGYEGDADFDLSVFTDGTVLDESFTYVQTAYGDMRHQAWDDALSNFSTAVLINPTNPTAALGYAALRVADILLDPEMIRIAGERLGIAGYPTSLAELFSVEWLERLVIVGGTSSWTDEEGNWHEEQHIMELFVPAIVGQENFDGILGGDTDDGIIDEYERLIALVSHVWQNNPGLNDLLYTIDESVNRGLDDAKQRLADAAEGASLMLTWDMLFDTYSEAYEFGWPSDIVDGDGDGDMGEPLVLVIGTTEILAMISFFDVLEMLTHMTHAYNYTLARDDGSSFLMDAYELYFNNEDGFFTGPMDVPYIPDQSPFSAMDFLTPAEDAMVHIDAARQALSDAFGGLRAVIEDFSYRTPEDGFFLNPATISGMTGMPAEALDLIIDFSYLVLDEVKESLDTGVPAYIPAPDGPEGLLAFVGDDPAPWPDAPAMDAFEVNFGALFASPLSGIFELTPYREPVWYTMDHSTDPPHFRKMSISEQMQVTPTNDELYYIHVPQSILTDLFSIANLQPDDPTTKMRVEWLSYYDENHNGMWDWYDDNGNDAWDPHEGEQIHEIGFGPELDNGYLFPLIDMDLYNGYLADDGVTVIKAWEYYDLDAMPREDFVSWLASFPDAESPLTQWTDEANVSAIIAYLDEIADWGDYAIRIETHSATPEGVYLQDGDLYLGVPDFITWHSVTPYGEVDPTTGYTSTGTVFYSWAMAVGY